MNALARLALSLGSFVLVGALLMLLMVKPGTPEFVISCLSAGIGLIGVLVAVALARWSIQRAIQEGVNR